MKNNKTKAEQVYRVIANISMEDVCIEVTAENREELLRNLVASLRGDFFYMQKLVEGEWETIDE